jgi:CheY-like chemotaxis protein/nitrogen-specific signal transduction histidine kinase/CHASE3 domain sensor protein
MMPNPEDKSFLQSVGGKILAACLIGAIAVALAWVVLRVGFKEILMTVDRLSAPNEKLRIVNDLFHNITRLDQLQKTYALRNPDKPAGIFRRESRHLLQTIDTLRQLSAGNPAQVQRLDSMVTILHNRNQLFDSYAKLKSAFVQNEALSQRIRAVGKVIANRKPEVDSSIIRTNETTTTTTIIPEANNDSRKKSRQSFFSRLFGTRKALELPPALKQVEEELKVQIDTLSVAKQDKSIQKVQQIMRRLENEQHQRTNRLLARELALINAEGQLHHQLLRILHAIESEEINLVKNNSRLATQVVNASIGRIKTIIIITSLVAAFLVFLIFIDISRTNKYRRQLIAAKEEAEYLGQVKQRFLANMSHELRTPLQSIIGFAEQARRQEKPNPEFLEAIYQSSDHLLQIVNEVLDYSRIVSDTFSFEQRPFSLCQLAAEVVETMKPQAARKRLAVVLESQVPDIPLLGDPFRLRQILYNLLGNAIKFTAHGQVTLKITAGAFAEQQQHYCLAVADTGIGIPASETNRIFKVFEQVDGAVQGTSTGTGLGLSIVKTLVESQGGSIAVSSEPGKGSTFTLQLAFPLAPAAPATLAAPRDLPAGRPLFSGEILVVDDDAFILQLCGVIFNKHHIRNTCTTDARAVLEKQWDENLQLVLTDIRMPEVNGLELCRALRSRVPASCRIVALTAQALPEEREAILAQGFDGLLMKPFREQELLALVGGQPSATPAVPAAPAAITGPGDPPPRGPEAAMYQPDFSTLIRMTGGEEKLLQAVLHQFMAETGQDLAQLQDSLQQPAQAGTRELVVEVVHRLAGRSGQIGAKKLASRLQALEAALLDPRQPPGAWLGELAVLQQEVKALKAAVADKLHELQAA